MTHTIIIVLLPVLVTLMLGVLAGWHHDFDGKQAAILNRMVRLYARAGVGDGGASGASNSGPIVPFVGVSVLGQLFGKESAISISVTSLAMNLIQVPACMVRQKICGRQ